MSGKESSYVRQKLVPNGQFSGVELKNFFISFRRLQIQKHEVTINLPCSGFSLCEHFKRQFIYAFFYIQNRKMYLGKKILCQYFGVFSPACEGFSSESILYVII